MGHARRPMSLILRGRSGAKTRSLDPRFRGRRWCRRATTRPRQHDRVRTVMAMSIARSAPWVSALTKRYRPRPLLRRPLYSQHAGFRFGMCVDNYGTRRTPGRIRVASPDPSKAFDREGRSWSTARPTRRRPHASARLRRHPNMIAATDQALQNRPPATRRSICARRCSADAGSPAHEFTLAWTACAARAM